METTKNIQTIKTMTTGELAKRYNVKAHTVSNWAAAKIISAVGKRGSKNLYNVKEVDSQWRRKHPRWRVGFPTPQIKATLSPKKKQKQKTPISMPLESNLGSDYSPSANYFTASQVVELIKAMGARGL